MEKNNMVMLHLESQYLNIQFNNYRKNKDKYYCYRHAKSNLEFEED